MICFFCYKKKFPIFFANAQCCFNGPEEIVILIDYNYNVQVNSRKNVIVVINSYFDISIINNLRCYGTAQIKIYRCMHFGFGRVLCWHACHFKCRFDKLRTNKAVKQKKKQNKQKEARVPFYL